MLFTTCNLSVAIEDGLAGNDDLIDHGRREMHKLES
jgi:hypothetical protein